MVEGAYTFPTDWREVYLNRHLEVIICNTLTPSSSPTTAL